jgi:hypothetical protein
MKRVSFRDSARKTWVLDECNVREDVADIISDSWELRVFKVTSPDSGNVYWVQVLRRRGVPKGKNEEWDTPAVFCNCPHGLFMAPLQVVLFGPCGLDTICKHAKVVWDFLKGGG